MMTFTTPLPPADCRAVAACLACGSGQLTTVLDLGRLPLANELVEPGDDGREEDRFPLGIQACEACRLVQLMHIVNPARLFGAYRYVPSTSSTWLEHCEALAEHVGTIASLRPGDLVVEIGSNDGTLLRAFQRRGQRILGVDPAGTIATRANASGVPTLNLFFGEATAGRVLAEVGPPRAVVSTNVLAHVPDPVGFVRGVRALLAGGGFYVNESPSLAELLVRNAFDTIYHEHVTYLSLEALVGLFRRAGLELVDATTQAIHGGTLRVVGRVSAGSGVSVARLERLLRREREVIGDDLSGLLSFSERVAHLRGRLREIVDGVGREGLRLGAYGATAKGAVLLGYCGLTRRHVEYIVDRNPLKQGLLMPGARIPIVGPEALERDPPDVLLLLAWNLANEIRGQLGGFVAGGGRFLVPIPEPILD